MHGLKTPLAKVITPAGHLATVTRTALWVAISETLTPGEPLACTRLKVCASGLCASNACEWQRVCE
jgi:hypothetical protein